MSSSEDDDNYINEGAIEGDKPKITEKQRNELLKKGEDSTCEISLPDINKGNGFFCEILYNENKCNVLIIRNKIINKILKKMKHLKISHKEKNIVILIENRILNLKIKKEKLRPFDTPMGMLEINKESINRKNDYLNH